MLDNEAKTAGTPKTPEGVEQQTALAELKHVMSTRQGRKTLWRLLQASEYDELSIRDATGQYHFDPIKTAFQEGRRSMGLAILNDMRAADEEGYFLMLRESKGY